MDEKTRGLFEDDWPVPRKDLVSAGESNLADLITAWYRAARIDSARDAKTSRGGCGQFAAAETKTGEPLTKRGPACSQ